jgi:hypothetical protein
LNHRGDRANRPYDFQSQRPVLNLGIGEGFPGKEVRIGRFKFLTEKGEIISNWEKYIIVNSFDSETSSLPIKIRKITMLKVVIGVFYFCIYCNENRDKSIDSYLRIEGYFEDKIIKLSSTPTDISISQGTGYISIIYENKTEIWNVLGQCIDTINGKALWKK